MTITYIGIGSNMDNPIKQVQIAIERLSTLPNTTYITHSSLYRSQPLDAPDQPDYINAVVALDTVLLPPVLLETLKELEKKQGREQKGERWGPRIIDLDILLYGDSLIKNERLSIPHPGLAVREFVLYPLAEIAKDLILPTGESILALKEQCPLRGMEQLGAPSDIN